MKLALIIVGAAAILFWLLGWLANRSSRFGDQLAAVVPWTIALIITALEAVLVIAYALYRLLS